MATDVYIELECERAKRLVEGLNDGLSRQLLRQYIADLVEEQQGQRLEREFELPRYRAASPAG